MVYFLDTSIVNATNPAKGLARLNMRDDDIPAMHPTPPLPTDSFRDITAEFFEASESVLRCLLSTFNLSADAVIPRTQCRPTRQRPVLHPAPGSWGPGGMCFEPLVFYSGVCGMVFG